MTRLVAVSQRVAIDGQQGERADALDQRWTFLAACGLIPLLLPNESAAALALMNAVPVRGLLLTGGNSLTMCGGNAPERDGTELDVLAVARLRGLPVLGVCRGMQVILHVFGVPLSPVKGHTRTRHHVTPGRTVNSYHDFGAVGDAGPLTVLARAADDVVEAVRHPTEAIDGVMWHPERCAPFADEDVRAFRGHFLADVR